MRTKAGGKPRQDCVEHQRNSEIQLKFFFFKEELLTHVRNQTQPSVHWNWRLDKNSLVK